MFTEVLWRLSVCMLNALLGHWEGSVGGLLGAFGGSSKESIKHIKHLQNSLVNIRSLLQIEVSATKN